MELVSKPDLTTVDALKKLNFNKRFARNLLSFFSVFLLVVSVFVYTSVASVAEPPPKINWNEVSNSAITGAAGGAAFGAVEGAISGSLGGPAGSIGGAVGGAAIGAAAGAVAGAVESVVSQSLNKK